MAGGFVVDFNQLIPLGVIAAGGYILNIFGFKTFVNQLVGIKETGVIVPITCPTGQHLVNGVCVPDTAACPTGQHMVNGVCVDDGTNPPPTNALLVDTFPTNYILSGVSPDGKWGQEYGLIGTRTSTDGKRVLYELPASATSTTGADTHSCLALTTQTFTSFEMTLQMRTIRHTRVNFPPKNWEVAWLFWSYTKRADLNNRSVNHYYFMIKQSGVEFGKKDNTETNMALEEQIFLPTAGSMNVELGRWYTVVIQYKNFHTRITVDGAVMVDHTDVPNNPTRMAHGQIGLYNEDSEVEFTNVVVKPF